jgi:hypothetical protein
VQVIETAKDVIASDSQAIDRTRLCLKGQPNRPGYKEQAGQIQNVSTF